MSFSVSDRKVKCMDFSDIETEKFRVRMVVEVSWPMRAGCSSPRDGMGGGQ